MAHANGPLRVGVGGPVGSGKTALMDALCKRLRDRFEIAAITNDIYTKWDAEYLVRSGALAAERIAGVETGGCPHTAIREDASINLAAIAEMRQKFPKLDLVLIESRGDNLAATFSPEPADITIFLIGVPRPSSVPVFYRNAATNVVQTGRLEVLGPDTSGEVEPVIVALNDGLWIGLGSDHTDRKAETMGIALSKQLCGKVMAANLWKYEDIASHWDSIVIRSYAKIDGGRTLYQEGPLALMRGPVDLMTRYGRPFVANTVVMCGTIGAKGEIGRAHV